MQAQDIVDTAHQLEEKGMTRPQAETIAAALGPLATRKALADAIEPLATRKDLAAVEERLGAEIKTLREKDLKGVEERLGAETAIMLQQVHTRIESTKVWLLGGLLGGLLAIALSIVVYALRVAAGPG